MFNKQTILSIVISLFVGFTAFAAPTSVRWTGAEDANADLGHVLDVIRVKTGITLTPANLLQIEDRDLANNHFTMWFQTQANTPISGQSLRIWKTLDTGKTVQVEALVDKPSRALFVAELTPMDSQETMKLVRSAVQSQPDDRQLRSVTWRDFWEKGKLVRVVRAKAKHGEHEVKLSLESHKVVTQKYREYPQFDGNSEFTVPVQVYPIYEQAESTGAILSRISTELRYLKAMTPHTSTDPYLPMRTQRYLASKQDPVLGLTVDGRAQGFWAMTFLKAQAADLVNQLPLSPNSFQNGGVVLEGRYATVNLYPDVLKMTGLSFTPHLAAVFKPDVVPATGIAGEDELIPKASLHGRPIASLDDAWTRPARRLPDNDPASYLGDGFDELQVYWSVSQLFDSLRAMGWVDPELSTRPFNAFLYDTDISYRDNAFYTDDTINFTTYSGPNMARDNSTIWHELGHGVMDRLMGDFITLADTGGLSEGMADFVAQLVLNDVTNGQPYEGKTDLRIFNHMGFYLTNEVHDDGEAYGGTMNDLLVAAMNQGGRAGLTKVTDLTLETMRLTRNNPGLTANDWFAHMLFADQLGNKPVRAPGELNALILQALSGRNFNLDGSVAATFTVLVGNNELTSNSLGARENPIKVKLAADATQSYAMSVKLKSSPGFQFKYPVTVKVSFVGGPLQGAIHWQGKEQSPLLYTLNSEADTLPITVSTTGKCDSINRPDGSCVDFAYLQVWNNGETQRPQAKKRFYLRLYPQ